MRNECPIWQFVGRGMNKPDCLFTNKPHYLLSPQIQKPHGSIHWRYLRKTGGASNIGTTTSTSVISFPKSGFESSRSSSVLVVTL